MEDGEGGQGGYEGGGPGEGWEEEGGAWGEGVHHRLVPGHGGCKAS